MSSIYETVKIKEGQIRLLQIISTAPHIECNLRVADLDDGTAFDALSYVWGDPSSTTDISVNGRRVSVTKNLSTALEYAREHLHQRNPDLWIWADAICINQTDIPEKNQQVPLMRDIYAQAGTVFCWLGLPEKGIFDAIDWIETVACECKMGDLSDHEHITVAKLDDATYGIASRMEALRGALQICDDKIKSTQNFPMPILTELYGSVSTDQLMDAIAAASRLINYLMRSLSSLSPSTGGFLNIGSMKSLIPPLRDISRNLGQVRLGSKNCTGGSLAIGSGLSDPKLGEEFRKLGAIEGSLRTMGQVLLTATLQLDLKLKDLQALVQKIEHQHLTDWCQNHPGLFSKGVPIDSPEQSGWFQIFALFESPYWQRVWIFQEVVLSQRPLFACGKRSITMESLFILNNWLANLGKSTKRKPDYVPDLDWILVRRLFTRHFMALSHMIAARISRKAYASSNAKVEFDWSVSGGLRATDPRDHIYGLLGLSHLKITPNYSQDISVTEACVKFFVEYVRAYRDDSWRNTTTMGELALLSFAGIGHNWSSFPGLPSWTPNFAGISRTEEPEAPVWVRNSENLESAVFGSSYSAQIKGYKMRVSAVMLDVVERIGPLLEDYLTVSGLHLLKAISWTLNLAMEYPQR
ncbi:hypothetical protein E8E14_012185 [Neopestalotiopsis sp. 37M]|nr:hypothetical protein E8E14_012185 [Neopestalotiopsis sp. 37M]